MPREYPAHPLPAVLAMVVRDGKVLLVRRGREPNAGIWGLPGGLVDLGEGIPEAAVRELREETGVEAEAGAIVDVFDAVTRDGEGRVRYHYVLIAVQCRWLAGEPTAGDDAAEAGWFSPADLAGMPCAPRLSVLLMKHAIQQNL
ncbi:MAG: NUDIX hydrolase [Solirubrobacterales bacterium]